MPSTTTPPLSAEVQQAEQFNANNQHQEAIDVLLIAIEKGDIEAMTRLGKRLLIGEDAPLQELDGVKLLSDAATQGSAEALCVLSVLFAVGAAHIKQDWNRAFESLILSAERGWLPAQEQLRVLCPNSSLSEKQASSDLWRQLADSIDLLSWHSSPAEKTLNESPLIRIFPTFASKKVCQWIIKKADGRLTPARVYDSIKQKETTSATRTNTATNFNLIEADIVSVLVQARMATCFGIPFRHLEATSVLHYDVGEEIANHFDFIDPNSPDHEQQIARRGQRIVTFILYLNDDYTGGETEFPQLDVSHKGESGGAIFFVNALEDGSADIRSLHAGRPIIEGEKWIVTQFIRNIPVF